MKPIDLSPTSHESPSRPRRAGAQSITIGEHVLSPPIAAAPMAGVTNQIFRRFARRFGASVVYTEMISAVGYKYGSKRTEAMMFLHEEEKPACIQLFGGEPAAIAEAAKAAEAGGAAYIDLNMACPVPKVTKGGGGAALLEDHDLALRIFEAAAAATSLPVTVKLRSRVRAGGDLGMVLAEKLAAHGAAALALHPRSAVRRYAGPADWCKLTELVRRVPVPVWGSGDVFSAEDVVRMLDETGCAGVMIARGALGNFWIFSQARDLLEGRDMSPVTPEQRLRFCLEFTGEMVEYFGADRGLRESRKHLLWFIKGVKGGSKLRSRVSEVSSVQELRALVEGALAWQGS